MINIWNKILIFIKKVIGKKILLGKNTFLKHKITFFRFVLFFQDFKILYPINSIFFLKLLLYLAKINFNS